MTNMTIDLLTPDQDKITQAGDFLQGFSSVILATVNHAGQPHSSYAPYILDQGNFYIYVSDLATHAQTLQQGYASLLLIADETQSKAIFARTRLSIDCSVSRITPSQRKAQKLPDDFDRLLDQFETRHGKTMRLIRRLPDFRLFELQPQQVAFVTGFGAAFQMPLTLFKQP